MLPGSPQGHRPAAGTIAQEAEFRLGQQLQKVGNGTAETDFENTAGHRPDIIDRSEIKRQRRPGDARNRQAQRLTGRLAGDGGAIGPRSIA
ncbi:MAG TPA: hypothetical protein VN627_07890 [Novosphingobium sp.]|nr:hypothetical protein [Novosphingobium sp.]